MAVCSGATNSSKSAATQGQRKCGTGSYVGKYISDLSSGVGQLSGRQYVSTFPVRLGGIPEPRAGSLLSVIRDFLP